MRFTFIAKHRGIWPMAWICEALGVSRSGFHAWLTRAPSQRSRDDEEIGARIRASHIGSYRTMVRVGSGTTFSPKAINAVCTRSRG